MSREPTELYDAMAEVLEAMVAQQERKVLALARRLAPGLTAEDVRNPHDFAALDDRDFHYEDGTLNGIQAALMALRAKQRGEG